MRISNSLQVIALCCAGVLAGHAADVRAQWLDYGVIRKADSHQCITELAGDNAAAPATLQMQACELEHVNGGQAWGWIKVEVKVRKGMDVYAFQNVASQACLGVHKGSTAAKARLVPVRCDATDPTQLWLRSSQLRPGTSPAGMSKWVNLKSRKCMELGEESVLRQGTCQWSGYWPQEFVVR